MGYLRVLKICFIPFVLLIILVLSIFFINKYKVAVETRLRKAVPVQQRMRILKELYSHIIRVSDRSNIKLFLNYGTLLGKIRDNDMICYDYDLDFGISDKEYDRLEELLSAYFKDTPGYKMNKVNLFNYQKAMKIIHIPTGLSADIVIFYNNSEYAWRGVHSLYSIYAMKECRHKYPIDWIYPLRPTTFLGKLVYMPNDPEKLLGCIYGNYRISDHKCNVDCTQCIKK